ncbi:MAG TPA: polyprenyl synthetase family protein, partial [Anaerolineales bacterium]
MIAELRNLIETELQRQVSRLEHPLTLPFHEMLTYHMGWSGEGAGPEATGKRIRPQLLCLVYMACQPAHEVQLVLPAAAAVELIHNFSLVHDDIEDNSPARRGRPTLWTKWGVPMAINAGDALFVMANQAMMDLAGHHAAETTLRAAALLHDTCLNLTRGQYLDMSFEERLDLELSDYWEMISGKTAALLSACCSIGAILGAADKPIEKNYAAFGHDLGLAFQVQDDILGIWGDEDSTGKSTASDLVEGKKSLPVLYGLHQNNEFARRWRLGPVLPAEVQQMSQLLRDEGAYDYAQEHVKAWTANAIADL